MIAPQSSDVRFSSVALAKIEVTLVGNNSKVIRLVRTDHFVIRPNRCSPKHAGRGEEES